MAEITKHHTSVQMFFDCSDKETDVPKRFVPRVPRDGHRVFLCESALLSSQKSRLDFVRAAQGFCVVGMLTYALSVVILIAYLTVQFLQRVRGVLIALCLLIFTSGCMTLMALVVMGIKGHDYLNSIKLDDKEVLRYFATSVDPLGVFYVGWSFIVAVISAFITLASFMFCMIEFVHINDVID